MAICLNNLAQLLKRSGKEDTDIALADAKPIWMEHLEIDGLSGRTGRRTHYSYDIVTVEPGTPLPRGALGQRCGFLSYAEILESELVTWSTQAVLKKLLQDQHIGVGVICRQNNGREYLMVRNRYGKYFFPAARLRAHGSPAAAIIVELRDKAKFEGHIELNLVEPSVDIQQQTPHLGVRRYSFHLVRMTLAPQQLLVLEHCLAQADMAPRWVTERELSLPADFLSDTVTGVSGAVLALDVC